MKAIKIPNSALLDVFGRPVAVNNRDLKRPSIIPYIPKAPPLNQNDANNKNPTVPNAAVKQEMGERLTVIGEHPVTSVPSSHLVRFQERLRCTSLLFTTISSR